MADARRDLLSVLLTMRLTGRNPASKGVIGAALAARLDRLIAALRGRPGAADPPSRESRP